MNSWRENLTSLHCCSSLGLGCCWCAKANLLRRPKYICTSVSGCADLHTLSECVRLTQVRTHLRTVTHGSKSSWQIDIKSILEDMADFSGSCHLQLIIISQILLLTLTTQGEGKCSSLSTLHSSNMPPLRANFGSYFECHSVINILIIAVNPLWIQSGPVLTCTKCSCDGLSFPTSRKSPLLQTSAWKETLAADVSLHCIASLALRWHTEHLSVSWGHVDKLTGSLASVLMQRRSCIFLSVWRRGCLCERSGWGGERRRMSGMLAKGKHAEK